MKKEKTERNHGKHGRIRHDANAEVQQHVSHVEWVPDIREWPACDEERASDGTGRTGFAAGNRYSPQSDELTDNHNTKTSYEGDWRRTCKKNHR